MGFVEALPAYYPTNGPDIEQPRQKFLKRPTKPISLNGSVRSVCHGGAVRWERTRKVRPDRGDPTCLPTCRRPLSRARVRAVTLRPPPSSSPNGSTTAAPSERRCGAGAAQPAGAGANATFPYPESLTSLQKNHFPPERPKATSTQNLATRGDAPPHSPSVPPPGQQLREEGSQRALLGRPTGARRSASSAPRVTSAARPLAVCPRPPGARRNARPGVLHSGPASCG